MTGRRRLLLVLALCWLAQLAFGSGWGGAGWLLLAAGAWALGGPTALPPPPAVPRRALLAGAAVVFAIALVPRLWRLGTVPPVWWDEAVEAYDARCVADGVPLEPLPGIAYHRSPLWTRAVCVAGRLGGFTFPGLRVPSVLAGALLASLVFALAAARYGWWPGALAGAFTVFHPWPLHLSRLALGNLTVPLGAVSAVLAATAAGWPVVRRAAVAGGLAAVTLAGYAAAPFVPALAAAAVWLFAPPRTPARRRLGAAALAGGIGAAALLATFVATPGFWGKAGAVSALANPGRLLRNAAETLPMFNARGDDDLRHQFPPGAPVLDVFLAPLFSFGLLLALRGAAEPRLALPLVWLVLGLLPGMASWGGERNLFRDVGAIPAVALLVAIGGASLTSAFGRRPGRVIAGLLFAGSAVTGLKTYLVAFPASPATAVWFRTYGATAGADLAALAARGPVALSPPLTLSLNPLEKLALYPALRAGRVVLSAGAAGPLATATVYRDPWGQPEAVLRVAPGEPAPGDRRRVEYRTLLDLTVEGDDLLRAGRAADAAALFRRYAALLPDSAVLAERCGFAEVKAGRPAPAVAAFRRALALGSRLPSTYDGLAAAYLALGRRADAERALEEALRLAPADPDLLADLARVRGGTTEAEER